MYKDVGKRIVAFLMLVCMFVTLVEWPTPVWAASGTSYTYQNGDGTVAGGTLDVDTVAAVFQTSQTEVLDRVQFEVHVEEGRSAKATVSYYMNIKNGQPDSGTRVFEKEMSVREGSNTFTTGLGSQVMNGKSSFAIVVSLEGAVFYTFGGTGTGQSYVRSDGSWKDMYTDYSGKCAAIRAFTYGAQAAGTAPIAGVQTYDGSSARAGGADGDVDLNKKNVLIASNDIVMVQMVGIDWDNRGKVSWRTEDVLIADVASPGTDDNRIAYIYGHNEGTTHVIATYNDIEYICTVTVTKTLSDGKLTLDPPSPVVYNGRTYRPSATVTVTSNGEEETLVEGENYRVSYQKKDGSASSGWVSTSPGENGAFIDVGSYQVWAQSDEEFDGYSGYLWTDFEIVQKNINDGTVRVNLAGDQQDRDKWTPGYWESLLSSLSSQEDLDKLIEIEDTEADENGDDGKDRRHLVLGTDYTLEVKADLTGIIIKGIGNYTGQKEFGTPQSIKGAEIRFDSGTEYIYTGVGKEPPFHVLFNGSTLSPEWDYEIVSWGEPNNVDVGQVQVTIRGTNNYYDTEVSGYYNIIPKDIDNLDCTRGEIEIYVMPHLATPINGTKEAVAEALSFTYNGMTLEYGKDYTIPNDATYNDTTGEYQIVVNGMGNYTGTRIITFTIGEDIRNYIDIENVKVASPVVYNGLEQTPDVTIIWKDNNAQLVRDQDYVIEYLNNINASTNTPVGEDKPRIRIRGIGNYGGVVETRADGSYIAFEIEQLSLQDSQRVYASLLNPEDGSIVPSYQTLSITYSPDPAELEPGVNIIFKRGDEDVPVVADTDYSLTYSVPASGVKVGTWTVTVTGTGNFKDTLTWSYNIEACNLRTSSADVIRAVLDQTEFYYTGDQIDPRPKMTITHQARSNYPLYTLVEGTDYAITYSDVNGAYTSTNGTQIEMGDYRVKATGQGNYTDYIELSYKITAIDIATVLSMDSIIIDEDELKTRLGSDYAGIYSGRDELNNDYAKDYEGPYFALLWYDKNDTDLNKLDFEILVRDVTTTSGWRVLDPVADYNIVGYGNIDDPSRTDYLASVTIEGKGRYYNTYTFQYLLAEDLGKYEVAISAEVDKTYTGETIELTADDIRVYDVGTSLSQRELRFGVDYTLSYEDSKDKSLGRAVNAGDAIVYVEDLPDAQLPSINGCFRYRHDASGADQNKKSDTLHIHRQSLSALPPVITYDDISVDYTGAALRPRDQIKIHHTNVETGYSRTLNGPLVGPPEGATPDLEGLDYKILEDTWTNNVNPSPTRLPLAFVEVEGIGNYKDKMTIMFHIAGKSLDDILEWTMDPDNTTYNGMPLTPNIIGLVMRGKEYTDTASIQANVCTWDPATDFRNNVNATTETSKAIITVHGVGPYTGSTRELEFDILPLEFQATAADKEGYIPPPQDGIEGVYDEYIYLSVQVQPVPTKVVCITNGSRVMLTEGQDYIVSYDTNMNVSDSPDHTAVILTGIGNYAGEYRINFEMKPKQLDGSDDDKVDPFNKLDHPRINVDPIDSQPWEGKAVTPVPRITYEYADGRIYELKSGVDFDLAYDHNTTLGEATVTITGKGNFAGMYPEEVTFQIGNSIRTDEFRVSYPGLEDAVYTYDGDPKAPEVIVEKVKSKDVAGNVTWEALQMGRDYTVEYVDPRGVTSTEGAINAGTATIVVKGIGIYADKVEQTFTILPKDLSTDDITLTVDVREDGTTPYTRGQVKPGVTVTYSRLNPERYPGQTLTEGADMDYTVSYVDQNGASECTEIGTVTVTVTGSGNNYIGERSTTFEIVPAEIGAGRYQPNPGFNVGYIPPQPLIEGKAELQVEQIEMTYYGYPLTPGVDYSIAGYRNNTQVGTATVIIQGEGNYTETLLKDFEIVENATNVAVTGLPTTLGIQGYSKSFEECVSEVTNPEDPNETAKDYFESYGKLPDWFKISFDDDIVVTMDGVDDPLEQGVDYEIEYVNNEWIGRMEVNVRGTGTKFSGVVPNTVLITMTLPGSAEEVADVPGLTLDVPFVEFTGGAVNGDPVISYYGKFMSEGTHFYVECSNNTSVGKNAKITITGNRTNGVFGTYEGTYEIVANESAFTITGLVEEGYMYRGEQIKPQIIVNSSNRGTLQEGTDYDLEYGSNTNAGEGAGYIRIIGKGNYVGSRQVVNFDILPWDIANLTITTAPVYFTYTGVACEPEVTLKAIINNVDYPLPASDYEVTTPSGANNTDAGSGRVTITGISGNVVGEIEKQFSINPKSLAVPQAGVQDLITVKVDPESCPYTGTEQRPKVIVTYKYGDREDQIRTLVESVDFSVTYGDKTHNNIDAGIVPVEIKGIGNYSGSRKTQFEITEQEFDPGQVRVTFLNGGSDRSYPFMGTNPVTGIGYPVEPKITVSLGGRELQEGVDYTKPIYANNTQVGDATVTINGLGGFSGTIQETFHIVQHDINANDIVVEPIPNQAYTGSPIIPEVVITCGGNQLLRGTDYDIHIDSEDYTNPGLVKMLIIPKGGFTGSSRTTTFRIAADISGAEIRNFTDTRTYKAAVFSIEELTQGVQVYVNGEFVSPSNYTINYATGSDGISAGEQKLILTGVGDYWGGSKEFSFTIKPRDVATEVQTEGFIEHITGTANYKQPIRLYFNNGISEITLEETVDYDVEYKQLSGPDNKWSMKVTGKDNYTGSFERTYDMETVDISAATVTLDSTTYTYTGSDIEPGVTVRVGDTVLRQNEDYSVSYENNRNVGIGTVKVTGQGFYNGEVTATFMILGRSISLADIAPSPIPTQIYTGKDIQPTVTLTDNGATLVEKTDYTLRYENNRKAGVGSVTAVGRGNYSATKSATFNILPYTVTTPAIASRTSNSITVKWTIGGMATGYEIQRQTNGGTWQQVGMVSSRLTSFTDQSLSANTSYTYRVRAYVTVDTSTYYGEWSGSISGTTTK